MNNKSRKREFRVMYDNSETYPYHIEYRYLCWLRVFGWHKITIGYPDFKLIKTLRTKQGAIDTVDSYIRVDNCIKPEKLGKQVWPEEQQ